MPVFPKRHPFGQGFFSVFRYIGPGLLVTVGFIDPGNWASNIAAGSLYGYRLLWIITLSTVMLVILQHNAAHLGIVTGKCLSEAATENMRPWLKNAVLVSAMGAAVSTALAELLGGAVALKMLFGLPVKAGALVMLAASLIMQLTNSYRRIEKIIIGFVSVIGFSFAYQLTLSGTDWAAAAAGWFTPSFPAGSMPIIMSVLGAVVMPHNLFLHSEVIQSRKWHLEDETVIKKQLRFEFADTLFSMAAGWAINSAIVIMAASAFFRAGEKISDLAQAEAMLRPLMGGAAAAVFAVALLFSGLSSSITAGMAGGSIYAGIFGEPYDPRDIHTKTGILLTMVPAACLIFLIASPFDGLVFSQMLLSIQLPVTVFTQIYLTSSKKVMGSYANSALDKALLWGVGLAVAGLNLALLASYLFPIL